MYYPRKLKSGFSIIILIPAITALTVFAITGIFFGLKRGQGVLGIIILLCVVFGLIGFIRTRNIGQLVFTLYALILGFHLVTIPGALFSITSYKPTAFFAVGTVLLILWLWYLTVTKQNKWRGREVLELAAMPVNETTNGFTGRPLSSGKAEYTKGELMEFTEFALRNLIAWPYKETNRIVFVIVMGGKEWGLLYGWQHDYSGKTWVAFDFEGNVSVNISKEDYLTYKEDLAFDQLCDSLGRLFIEFLELYKRGEAVRIIDRMNALKLSYFA